MNKYLVKASKIILCMMLAATSASYAADQERLAKVLREVLNHVTDDAIPWTKRFLDPKSKEPFIPLYEDFVAFKNSFEQTAQQVQTRSGSQDEMSRSVQDIVKNLQKMILGMEKELAGLKRCTNTFAFMSTMNKLQVSMNAILIQITKDIDSGKRACTDETHNDLRDLLTQLRKAIDTFKKDNNNAASALMKRAPTLISK